VIWLRSGLFLLLLPLSVLGFGLPMILFGRLVPYRWLGRMAGAWGRVVLWLLRFSCGLGYRLQGAENLPDVPAIILCKHQSAWETIALRALLPPAQTWVLKRELIRIPIFGWALSVFDPIAINRSAGRRAMKQLIAEGQYWLGRGRWVIIFPEGTRVAPGERRTYGIGGALLAERSGRPIVPVAHNAGIFWGRRRFLKHPGVIDIRIGPVIVSEGRRAVDINREVEEWIEGTVARLPQHP
jgi:1-acyl-sn-glycerol-3-phosphate acyltransferase